MRPQPVEKRVEDVEERLTVLEQLPGRVDRIELQIVQLRADMRDEISALRREMRVLHEDIAGRLGALGERLGAQTAVLERVLSRLSPEE